MASVFAAPVAAYSASCDSDVAFDPLMRLGATPLYLFSGTFFPTDQLPLLLEWATKLFPLWHGVELARMATTGSGRWLAAVHLLVLLGYVATGFAWGRATFARRLSP